MTQPLTAARTVALLLCAALVGCSAPPTPPAPMLSTSPEKAREAARIKQVLRSVHGDAARGHAFFVARCARCHTLNNEGGKVGPDLTPYTRDADSLDFMISVIIDPQREVHDYHTTFEVQTTDGRTLTGVILEQGGDAVVLIDANGQQVKLPAGQVRSMTPVRGSLMPETVLGGLTDPQLADLFAYIMKH